MRARIELTRINNRFIHGQAGLAWGSTLNIDTAAVADNLIATNNFAQKLMQSAAFVAGRQIRFYIVHGFICVHNNNTSRQKLSIVVQSPHEARLLVEVGVELKRVNVGNMHYGKGRVTFSRKVYLIQPGIENINYMTSQGIEMFYQGVPGSTVEKFSELDYEAMKRRR